MTDTSNLDLQHQSLIGKMRPFEEDPDNRPTIAEFYANKGVFVTGGTGFLGCVLIEALLSTTPNIGRIYVLVRGKRGDNPENRVKKLLSKQVMQSSLYIHLLTKHLSLS